MFYFHFAGKKICSEWQWTKIDDHNIAFNMKTQLSYVGYDCYTIYCVEVDIFNSLRPVFFMQISRLYFIAVMLSGENLKFL